MTYSDEYPVRRSRVPMLRTIWGWDLPMISFSFSSIWIFFFAMENEPIRAWFELMKKRAPRWILNFESMLAYSILCLQPMTIIIRLGISSTRDSPTGHRYSFTTCESRYAIARARERVLITWTDDLTPSHVSKYREEQPASAFKPWKWQEIFFEIWFPIISKILLETKKCLQVVHDFFLFY